MDLLVENDIRVLFGLIGFGAVARSWIMKKKKPPRLNDRYSNTLNSTPE